MSNVKSILFLNKMYLIIGEYLRYKYLMSKIIVTFELIKNDINYSMKMLLEKYIIFWFVRKVRCVVLATGVPVNV